MSTAQKTDGELVGFGPVFLFLGPARHGKTTARKHFAELTGIPGASCSDVIYPLLADYLDITEEELRNMPKEEARPKLIEFGDWLCGKRDNVSFSDKPLSETMYRGPSSLVRALYLSGIRVIDGVRRREELWDASRIFDWLNVPLMVFWVERPGADQIQDNTEVTVEDADVTLLNDSTPEHLKEKVKAWLDTLPQHG